MHPIIHPLIQISKSLPTTLPSNIYLLKYIFHNQITPQIYSWVKCTPPAQFSYLCFLALGHRMILFSLSILAPKILRYSKYMQIYEVNPVASLDRAPMKIMKKINCSLNSFLKLSLWKTQMYGSRVSEWPLPCQYQASHCIHLRCCASMLLLASHCCCWVL